MAESSAARPNPNEKLVRVFDTEQESEALVVRGLLESAGIECDVTSLDAQQDILPGVGGTIILVREDDAEEARRVIEEYRRAPTSVEDDERSEEHTSELQSPVHLVCRLLLEKKKNEVQSARSRTHRRKAHRPFATVHSAVQ